MESRTIVVRFKQTGEHFSVPVSSTTTVQDIIKYICKQSIKSTTIDYNDYYLVLVNNETILADERIFEEIRLVGIENPDYQLCMKAEKRVEMVNHLREYVIKVASQTTVESNTPPENAKSNAETESNENSLSSIPEDVVTNQPTNILCASKRGVENKPAPIPPPKSRALPNTQSENFCGISSNRNEEVKNVDNTELESNVINPCPAVSPHVLSTQENVGLSGSTTVPNGAILSSGRPEKLANTYQHYITKVNEVGARLTRDPVKRRDISETYNEMNILLLGAPRVGKSTLINAICGKSLAKARAGLGACTNKISSHFLRGDIEVDSGEIKYRYNFWDTPGIETWTHKDIHKILESIKQKPKSDILCMIYCASPSSFANIEQLGQIIKECIDQHIFCALVCTNKWAGSDEQRDAVMENFQQLLEKYHTKTREENGISFFGNMGLCTAVNCERFVIKSANIVLEPSGVDEFILGIMESLDDEKISQWCMLTFENKRFWKNLSNFPTQLTAVCNKLLPHKKF